MIIYKLLTKLLLRKSSSPLPYSFQPRHFSCWQLWWLVHGQNIPTSQLYHNTFTSSPHSPPLQQHLPIFLLLGLHLNLKLIRFCSTALTSSVTLIRFLPRFWKNLLLSLGLFLPSPTTSSVYCQVLSSPRNENGIHVGNMTELEHVAPYIHRPRGAFTRSKLTRITTVVTICLNPIRKGCQQAVGSCETASILDLETLTQCPRTPALQCSILTLFLIHIS